MKVSQMKTRKLSKKGYHFARSVYSGFEGASEKLPAGGLRLLVRLYQVTLSPFIGNQCRFHPTCSHYALQALEQHGALRGGLLALRRLLRCHPFHAGGFDPVPTADKLTSAEPAHPDGREPRSTEIHATH